MTIVYSPVAVAELDEIWEYNARTYDADRADSYIEFLQNGIDALTENHTSEKMAPLKRWDVA